MYLNQNYNVYDLNREVAFEQRVNSEKHKLLISDQFTVLGGPVETSAGLPSPPPPEAP